MIKIPENPTQLSYTNALKLQSGDRVINRGKLGTVRGNPDELYQVKRIETYLDNVVVH